MHVRRFDETIPNDPIFKVHRDDQSLLDIVVRNTAYAPIATRRTTVCAVFLATLGKDEAAERLSVVVLSFRRADAAEYKKTYFQRYRFLWQLCLGHYGIYRRIKKLLIKAGILRREPSGLGI